MNLTINGKAQDVVDIRTAGDLLGKLNVKRERVALLVNENVVRRADLDNTALNEGDTIEIITMVGGG